VTSEGRLLQVGTERAGIDLEQFARDPYGSGIQRVLQQLAIFWPMYDIEADFIFPDDDSFALLNQQDAARVLSIPFSEREAGSDLRELVRSGIEQAPGQRVQAAELQGRYTTWLLPEVSYFPSVLERLQAFHDDMLTVMIGFDALPMTQPSNYRFPPGMARNVNEYFLQLIKADRVVCISDSAREEIVGTLRRPADLITVVAHPGGDHFPTQGLSGSRQPVRFLRLGTLEARKMPAEILAAFLEANQPNAELVFVGGSSASYESINTAVQSASDSDSHVTWIQGASDQQVRELIADSSIFLAIGIEGYGIPVLEAIAAGTPVVYSGIQPAAELMEGFGAVRHAGHTHQDLVDLFAHYSQPDSINTLNAQLDVDQIPTWKSFADSVAQQCKS
jgi:glycosyltransferase involved in cell wall biosynthesis